MRAALVQEYFDTVAAIVGVPDWRVTYDHDAEPGVEDAGAEIEMLRGRRAAYVRLVDRFARLSPEEQRYIVVHELVHCHVAVLAEQVECDLPAVLGSTAWPVFHGSFLRNLEYAVDGLARAFAALCPLPELAGDADPEREEPAA